jgi:hypothetical protein
MGAGWVRTSSPPCCFVLLGSAADRPALRSVRARHHRSQFDYPPPAASAPRLGGSHLLLAVTVVFVPSASWGSSRPLGLDGFPAARQSNNFSIAPGGPTVLTAITPIMFLLCVSRWSPRHPLSRRLGPNTLRTPRWPAHLARCCGWPPAPIKMATKVSRRAGLPVLLQATAGRRRMTPPDRTRRDRGRPGALGALLPGPAQKYERHRLPVRVNPVLARAEPAAGHRTHRARLLSSESGNRAFTCGW